MTEYHGSLSSDSDIAQYLQTDMQPSGIMLSTVEDLKRAFKSRSSSKASMIAFFNPEDMIEDENSENPYSVHPWGQFQAAADSLRG